jgi:hypothetical protein
MNLEDTIEPLELRPHHIEVFIRDARQTIERETASDYSPELAVKVLEMYDAAVSGRKIRVVPSIDDICKQCRKICPEKEDDDCPRHDSESEHTNKIAVQLKLKEGKEYSFEELQTKDREYWKQTRQRMQELKREQYLDTRYKNWKVRVIG